MENDLRVPTVSQLVDQNQEVDAELEGSSFESSSSEEIIELTQSVELPDTGRRFTTASNLLEQQLAREREPIE